MDLVSFSFSARRLVYLCLVGMAVLLTTYFFSGLSLQYLWLSAWVLAILPMQGTFLRHLFMMSLSLCLILITIALSVYTSHYFLISAVYLFMLTFLMLYFGREHKRYAISFVYIVVFAIISHVAITPLEFAQTILAVIIGGLIAVLIYMIYLPAFHAHRWHRMGYRLCFQLNAFVDTVFDCMLHPDYSYAVYSYERKLHLQKMSIMATLQKFKSENHLSNKHDLTSGFIFERIFASVQDASLLRLRESDYASFELSVNEFVAIKQAYSAVFSQLANLFKNKKLNIDFAASHQMIEQFDNHCQQVLFVAVNDPLIYLYFLASIKTSFNLIEQVSVIIVEA